MRKRSKYTPKPVNPLAYLVAIDGTKPLPIADQIKRASALREAVDKVCQGRATIPDWRFVFDAINMAEQWIRMKLAQGINEIECLQDMVENIMDRQKNTGTKALNLQEREALSAFAANYAELLGQVTMAEYARAQEGVEDRVRRVLAGERMPVSMRVLEAA